MNERRRQDRHQLLFHAPVMDRDGGAIGHLIDVSPTGLMIATEQPLEAGQQLCLRIPLPIVCAGVRELTTPATAQWSEPTGHPAYHRNGLGDVEFDDEQLRALTMLFDDYRLRMAE